MNSNTIWMWVGILVLGTIAVVRVQAALTPEEVSATRRDRDELTARDAERLAEEDTVLTSRSYDVGDCVTWDQAGGWRDTKVVPCEDEHLLEIAGRAEHPGKADDAFPSDGQWSFFLDEHCGAMVAAYLDGRWDPRGNLGSGAIHPLGDAWAQGERTVWCGVASALGEDPDQLAPFQGRASEIDQARVYAVGTCLETVAGVVLERPCDQPHHYLVLGELDLSGAETRPGDDEIFARCAEAMGRTQWENDQIVTFFGFEPESWAAGTRRGSCAAAAVDASGTPVLQQPGVLQL